MLLGCVLEFTPVGRAADFGRLLRYSSSEYL